MIRHIVLWKLLSREEADKQQCFQRIKAEFEGMRGKIPGMLSVSVECGINPNGYDVCLYCEFDSFAHVKAYLQNPRHLKALAYVNTIILEKAVSDTVIMHDTLQEGEK